MVTIKNRKGVQKLRDFSQIMRRVKGVNTFPERIFRKALRIKGLRYQICPSSIDGKPDIVFPSSRLAIFVDGDFWHGRQWIKRGLVALEDQFKKTKTKDYWLAKIRRNMRRDCAVTARLLANGWTVLRFWESEVNKNLERCVEIAAESLKKPTFTYGASIDPGKTFAEFFAGIGLMRLGLEREGWNVAFANDIETEKYKMYQAHFQDPKDRFVVADIHSLRGTDMPTVTLATASFPCNDLSLAGGRQGLGGKQSSAFWGFIGILQEMNERKPPLVLIENVTGFLTSHNGKDFQAALLALNRLGYMVDAFIVDASHFVPQSRQRLFVIGMQNNPNVLRARGALGFYESEIRPKALAEFIFNHPEIDWNTRPLPSLPRLKTTLRDILDDIPQDDSQWWSPERADYLLNQMSRRHRVIAEMMIDKRKWSYGTIFRRVRQGKSMAELRVDGLAGCLRTPRGGSGRQILFKAGYGKYQARLLSPRECARLMGADEFIIQASLNQALFGFGDAVCVPVIEWIARYYLNPVVAEIIRGTSMRAPAKNYEKNKPARASI